MSYSYPFEDFARSVDSHAENYIDRLREAVAIPSVSAEVVKWRAFLFLN